MFTEIATLPEVSAHIISSGMAGFGALGELNSDSARDKVKNLQIALNYWASAGLTVDGVFGPLTNNALVNWDTAIGLIPDGGYKAAGDNELASLGLNPDGTFFNNAPLANSGTPQTPAPTGTNNPPSSGSNGRVSFEWKAPATVLTVSWNTAQQNMGSALSAAGFDVQYNSYEFSLLTTGSNWILVVRGNAPSGYDRNAINNRLISAAETAGFHLGTTSLTTNIQVAGTDGGNNAPSSAPPPSAQPKGILDSIQGFLDKKFGFLGGTVSGAAIAGIGILGVFLLKRD